MVSVECVCDRKNAEVTSKLISKTVPVLPSLDSSLIFPLDFYLPWLKTPDFPSVSSLNSLPFLSCCHQQHVDDRTQLEKQPRITICCSVIHV